MYYICTLCEENKNQINLKEKKSKRRNNYKMLMLRLELSRDIIFERSSTIIPIGITLYVYTYKRCQVFIPKRT